MVMVTSDFSFIDKTILRIFFLIRRVYSSSKIILKLLAAWG